VRQLDAFASVIDARTDKLLSMLDRPRTLDDLVADGIVYRPGTRPDHFGESVERRTISMHLDELAVDGLVTVVDGVVART
jgi:DNA-binding transcriptional ArsR family regulator